MLCPPGMGRMAAMERLLATGNFSEISAEEANREKLAAKTIHKELNEADEANLLEEADMHVFDCKPMSDPLHLVSCNACKKPVKASQYAAHAERCGALMSAEDTGLELDGGAGHKKPPRKGRKKIFVSQDNQAATNFEQERSESLDGDDTAASETANMDDMHTGIVSSLTRELKRNGSSPSMDGALVGDGSGVSPGSTNHSGGVISPLKRARTPSESVPSSDGLETHCGVSAETGPCCQGAHTCKMHSDSSKRSAVGVKQPYDAALGRQKPRQDLEPAAKADHLIDGPIPLATKVYHLQRNHQLRAALGHLYRETIAKEHSSDSVSPRLLRSNGVPSPQVSSPSNLFSEAPKEGMNQKKVVRKPDQILAQSSELCLGVSGGYPSMMTVPNQFRDSNFARPTLPVDNGSMGMMRRGYIPPSYTFPVNPGATLGNVPQANGVMPVV
ncbi:unnamed protein product [Victoria cruziana]